MKKSRGCRRGGERFAGGAPLRATKRVWVCEKMHAYVSIVVCVDSGTGVRRYRKRRGRVVDGGRWDGIILKREFVHLFLSSVCTPRRVCILFYRLKSQASNYCANDFFSLSSHFFLFDKPFFSQPRPFYLADEFKTAAKIWT